MLGGVLPDDPPRSARPAAGAASAPATAAGATPSTATPSTATSSTAGPAPARSATALAAIEAYRTRHPKLVAGSALGLAFVLLATGAATAGVASAARPTTPTSSATSSVTATRAQPEAIPASSRLRTCSITAAAANPGLAVLTASVINANTGEVLYDRSGADPVAPADVVKLVTAVVAVNTLGESSRLSTRVLDGTVPGTIVLQGGGDPTLATSKTTVYEGAPLVADLAKTAIAEYKKKHPTVPITQVVLDTGMWNVADAWDPSWPESERTDGFQPLVVPLMIDGDRQDPTKNISPRSADPVLRAGQVFAQAAGLSPTIAFSRATAAGTTVLAEVKSQPVSTLIRQMFVLNDNAIAESLARLSSKVSGADGSAASLQQLATSALTGAGLRSTTGVIVKDGSGESPANALPPELAARLLIVMRSNTKGLGTAFAGLPIGGKSGDLTDRFTGANAAAGAAVMAQSGWIHNTRSLAGVVSSSDGTPLAFTFVATGDAVSFATREALDTLAAALHGCGNNLSNT